jgi:Na+/phosphate symporter
MVLRQNAAGNQSDSLIDMKSFAISVFLINIKQKKLFRRSEQEFRCTILNLCIRIENREKIKTR